MRSRTEILTDLIKFNGDIVAIQSELSHYPWDIETPLLTFSKMDLLSILNRNLSNELSFQDIVNWANAIECRDDLDFDQEETQELIFELANPETNGELTVKRLAEISQELQK